MELKPIHPHLSAISEGEEAVSSHQKTGESHIPADRHPFERLLSKKMNGTPLASEEIVSSPVKFSMTIRDYLTNPVSVRSGCQKTSSTKPVEATPLVQNGSAEIQSCILEAEKKYRVPSRLIQSIIKQESAYNPQARSKAGALGLMQLMPKTAQDLGVKNPMNIRENIDGGVKYFRKMLDMFGQDKKLALAAYNAGPGAVLKHRGLPPYAETKNYVSRILKYFSGTSV